MLFNSYIFILLFLPIVLLGYFGCNKYAYGKSGATGLMWLFLASLTFYGYQNPKYITLIVGSILVNYVLTIGKKRKFISGRIMLILALLFNFGLLFYYKYYNFFMDNMANVFHTDWEWRNIVLPLGISFFTFQQVSYVVDYALEKTTMDYSLIEYATFVSFFPQLVAGPIVLHSELIPQFRDRSKKVVDYNNMSQGLYAFSKGLGKKVLLADNLSKITVWGFDHVWELNTISAIVVSLSYAIQLYYDFSGYCDMAIGIAKMFNFTLPINFNSPYKAKSVEDFWKRWHITLSRFFRQYVYIPLGGSRKGTIWTFFNSFFIFLLSGLWHGANWTFVAWGTVNGIMVAIEKTCKKFYRGSVHPVLKLCAYGIYRIFIFLFFVFAFVFFRSESIQRANVLYRHIFMGGWYLDQRIYSVINKLMEVRIALRFTGLQPLVDTFPYVPCFILLVLILLGTFLMKNTQEKMAENHYDWKKSCSTIFLLVWCVLSLSDVSEFLYFNF